MVATTPRIIWATRLLQRMRGLLGRKTLSDGEAMYIVPCRAIHTRRMQFFIDARFYDKKRRLVKTVRNIAPGRWFVWGGWKAHGVLESRAGDLTFEQMNELPPFKGEER